MGPVTLNKEHFTNKAGVEVCVIPIRRSPYHSPKSLRKIKRPHSELGYQSRKRLDERGSLPDLLSVGKVYTKGSILDAILKRDPSSFLEAKSDLGSTQSLYGSVAKSLGSTESLSKGAVTSAVMSWLSKESPFGSLDSLETEQNVALPYDTSTKKDKLIRESCPLEKSSLGN